MSEPIQGPPLPPNGVYEVQPDGTLVQVGGAVEPAYAVQIACAFWSTKQILDAVVGFTVVVQDDTQQEIARLGRVM